jgi:hypothetical protein
VAAVFVAIAVTIAVSASSLITVFAAIAVTHAVAAMAAVAAVRSEFARTFGLACDEVASAGTLGDVPDCGTRCESRAECEDSAGNPASGDEFLSIDGDRLFDGVFFLSHVRHPFGSCVSHDHSRSRVLTFSVLFLCVA